MSRSKNNTLFVCAALSTPLGVFHLVANDQALIRLDLPGNEVPITFRNLVETKTKHPVLHEALAQLQAYLQGRLRHFSLPLAPQGTHFQQAVWQQLCDIPYGSTRTYGEVAARIGNSNKARAVGAAARVNPLAIVIPCHRMIGVNGKLVGFGGGLPLKQYLLDLEAGRLNR